MAQKCFGVGCKKILVKSQRFTCKSHKLFAARCVLCDLKVNRKKKLVICCVHCAHSQLQKDLTESVAVFMAYVLESVNEISKNYLANEKRYNYTTPKSYLELISLYSKLLTEKTDDHIKRIQRLENGLIRLAQCGQQVDSLKVSYAISITHRTQFHSIPFNK